MCCYRLPASLLKERLRRSFVPSLACMRSSKFLPRMWQNASFRWLFILSAIAALVRLGKVKRNMHIITLLRTCRLFLLGLQLSVFECCLPIWRWMVSFIVACGPLDVRFTLGSRCVHDSIQLPLDGPLKGARYFSIKNSRGPILFRHLGRHHPTSSGWCGLRIGIFLLKSTGCLSVAHPVVAGWNHEHP